MKDILALKYRPKKLADLVGQEHAAQALSNAIASKKLHHALLFTGMFGTGKTSSGRIVAASINCEKGYGIEPCGECDTCKNIFQGKCLDVKELNAASNRGIDDIRGLVEYCSQHPLETRYKVVIVDEIHGLSRDAAESFLKLLEEPPEKVIFILATTDPQKLKQTIFSRCIPFRFNKIQWNEIAQHLKSVATAEHIQIEDSALKIAAKLAKGSMRNSLQNLQLMVDYSGGKLITAEVAQHALGGVDDNKYFAFVDAIISTDAFEAIKIIQSMFNDGQNIEHMLEGIMDHLRNLMIVLTCKTTAGLLYLSEEEKKVYAHQVGKMSISLVVDLISLLVDVSKGIAVNVNPQTLLEQFVIRGIMSTAQKAKEQANLNNIKEKTHAST